MDAKEKSIFVSTQTFMAPFEYVCPALSNPLNLPEYYPNWVSEMRKSGDNEFLGQDETSESFTISPLNA